MLKKLLYIGFFLIPVFAFSQSCPRLLSPAPGTTNVPVETTITWQAIIGVPSYNISIGTTPGGNDIIREAAVGTNTSYTPPLGLPDDTEVFVTITLFFFGDQSQNIICPSISFRTEDVVTAPNCTSLRSPTNGEREVNVKSNIRWNYSPGATSYFLSIGTTLGGTEIFGRTNFGNT